MVEAEELPKSGVLKSQNYPECYPNSHDSTQTIQVAEGKAIRWTWTNFNTEPEYDFVQILDEDPSPKLWGSSLPPPVTRSKSNIVHVKFHTDGVGQRTGWKLEWSEVDGKNDNLFATSRNVHKSKTKGIISLQYTQRCEKRQSWC